MAKKRAAVEESEPEVESELSEEVDEDCSGDDYDPEEDMKENRPKSSSKSQNKSSEKTVWDALNGKAGKTPTAKTPKSASKRSSDNAVKLRRSMVTVFKSQMVYKKSLKHGSSRLFHEIPNLSVDDLEEIMGPKLWAKATKGKKQITVTTSSEDVYDLLGGSMHKPLRYGALLCIKDDAVKLTYSRNDEMLKATGLCTMLR